MNEFEANTDGGQAPVEAVGQPERSLLDEVLHRGAHRMLLTVIEAEVADYIKAHRDELDEDGRRLVVRNGRARERTIVTPVGCPSQKLDRSGRSRCFTPCVMIMEAPGAGQFLFRASDIL